jgi:hypothetical protein
MNSCIDRAGFVICICGGLVHQNCFSSLSPKSWAAPHDTSLISIDVTHRRDGQGRGDICFSLFFLLFWSLGRESIDLFASALFVLFVHFQKFMHPACCLVLGHWCCSWGARVAGWDWEGGGTCLSLYNGFMRYGLSALFTSHSELLWAVGFCFFWDNSSRRQHQRHLRIRSSTRLLLQSTTMFTHAVVFVMAVSLAGIGGFYSGVFVFFFLLAFCSSTTRKPGKRKMI